MPKTHATERSTRILDQESKASVGVKPEKSGSFGLRVVDKSAVSDDMGLSLPPKLPEVKQPQSSTEPLQVVEFGWEKFHQIAHELPPLFVAHWKELALNQDTIPLVPDWDKYYRLDVEGVLHILTARVSTGALVGYCFLMVGPHLHYASTLWSHADMYWLDPFYRQGWTGARLFKETVKGARLMGAANLTLATKHHFMDNRVTKLLKRLGFAPIETIHAMRLT
jgi:GNAT superfamily N-acetyltransferase